MQHGERYFLVLNEIDRFELYEEEVNERMTPGHFTMKNYPTLTMVIHNTVDVIHQRRDAEVLREIEYELTYSAGHLKH